VRAWAVVGLLGLGTFWGWLSAFGWLDVPRLCHIRIDVELLEGDRRPIRAAIDLVRREDPPAYRALCHWIDRIQEERQCDAGDPQADPRVRSGGASPDTPDSVIARARQAAGCYVRGSRVIVLRRAPEGGGGPALVRERAEALKRLARHSQAFWIERVR
jgi:hypothetical protein